MALFVRHRRCRDDGTANHFFATQFLDVQMSAAMRRAPLTAELLLPIALGTCAFFLIIGPRALNPQNIAWLNGGDLATHYLGWLFYSRSAWTIPLGMNPDYGLELGNAIVFSDSNPLLAFLFKPFVALLPQPFQYFGIWLLACFVLQAWFAWKLVGLITPRFSLRLLAAGLFVFSAPMIFRAGGHPNLAGHFFVVAALYFALHPELQKRTLVWGTLLLLAAWVHAYLLAMAGALWIANLCGQRLTAKLSNRDSITEFVAVFAVVAIACWQAGYFAVGSGAIGGSFGYYRMNLLSIIDSNNASYILKDIPEGPGDYEGINFLGLGVILLMLLALPRVLAGQSEFLSAARRFPMLLLVFLALTLFALSNNVGIGTTGFKYPLPENIVALASYFRASGRMFWPVFYAIVFTVIFITIRSNSHRAAVFLLGGALLVQIADSYAGWQHVRKTLMVAPSSEWATPMVSPFWKEAAAKYKKVRWILPAGHIEKWQPLASYAGSHGLATDAVYLARIDPYAIEKARAAATDTINTGQYESDALYIFDDNAFRIASFNIDKSTDLFFRVDGFNVLAPRWKKCAPCIFRVPDTKLSEILPVVKLGEKMLFGQSGSGLPYLMRGWAAPDVWGTWADGPEADIIFPVDGKLQKVILEASAYVSERHPLQEVSMRINNEHVLNANWVNASAKTIEISIPENIQREVLERGNLHIRMRFANAIRPADIGVIGDNRKLSIGLRSVTLF
jgi:uncharacterized membrane protein